MYYQAPQINVYLLDASDVIATSGLTDGGAGGSDGGIRDVNDLDFV